MAAIPTALPASCTTPAPAFAALAAPVAEVDDDDLMRLGAAFQRLQRRVLELTVPYFDVVEIPDEVRAEHRSLAPVMHRLAEQMADMHAITAAGLRMKASALLFYTGYLLDGRRIGTAKMNSWAGRSPGICWGMRPPDRKRSYRRPVAGRAERWETTIGALSTWPISAASPIASAGKSRRWQSARLL